MPIKYNYEDTSYKTAFKKPLVLYSFHIYNMEEVSYS